MQRKIGAQYSLPRGNCTPEAVFAVNGALTVLADNELAPATFAARVAASTNADLYNCVAAAIGAHVGFSTGTATEKVETLLLRDIASREGLPDVTATAVWIISRTAGWVAHVLEQRAQAFLLRPRAKYIAALRM
ncbi:citrate/2-methylcitrate synthase [Paraburkholderia caledonica]|uniref:citrate/2-methylcitrate synthase n=1 Tax=Paraburkholderia caledonica TaxID=134536 RepID=UPI0038BAA4DA